MLPRLTRPMLNKIVIYCLGIVPCARAGQVPAVTLGCQTRDKKQSKLKLRVLVFWKNEVSILQNIHQFLHHISARILKIINTMDPKLPKWQNFHSKTWIFHLVRACFCTKTYCDQKKYSMFLYELYIKIYFLSNASNVMCIFVCFLPWKASFTIRRDQNLY